MLGHEVSVVVSGRDQGGTGVVVELTGLRDVGPDPDDPAWGVSGSWVFGFDGQQHAFYIDPDAFVEGWASGRFVHIETTFGTIELAGAITRPGWF
ncbi:MAG: hypothetical protein M3N47_06455 [Chloroflexota bacterium]|nr:hypothetical protein [Chloroflexota bacterium]